MAFDTSQALSIQAARTIDVGRGNGGSTPASWLLTDGYYMARNVDPIQIYPRPDSETQAWAKHRRHYPGIPYEVPIGVAFGAGLPYFELIEAPTGATIGEWLVESGDALIYPDDYGTVKWNNPTVGTHSFHVRVLFQDGFTPINIQWTLEVTIAGTIFIDSVNGSDSTGDGTIGNPFQTINSFWKDSVEDAEFSGYQVCYRGGTHDITADNTSTGVQGGNWRLEGVNKPLVHYGHPDESVVLDLSMSTIVFSSGPINDVAFFHMTLDGCRYVDNTRQFACFTSSGDGSYDPNGSANRFTFYDIKHTNMLATSTTSNNAGSIFSPNTGGGSVRWYWYFKKITFDNVRSEDTVYNQNFNGYYLSRTRCVLGEDIRAVNSDFGYGILVAKSTAIEWCLRRIDSSESPKINHRLSSSGSYDTSSGGPFEFSYSLVNQTDTGTTQVGLETNFSSDYDPNNPDHNPFYIANSTISRNPVTGRHALSISNGWPYTLTGVLIVSDNLNYFYDDPVDGFIIYDVSVNPLDSGLSLTGAERDQNLGVYGHEIKPEFRGV